MPRPSTLPAAIALFASPAPLRETYDLTHEPGEQQRALVLRTLEVIEADERCESLFPGAAGTGKTTTLILLLSVLDDCGVSFRCVAPTHKAAGCASESLNGQWDVSTHHRLWCGSVEEDVEEGEEYASDLHLGVADDRTVSERVLIIDESSMISEEDLSNIRTVAPDAIIIGVGDHHQLPPVGGRPGFDWTDADAVGLTQVFRQAAGSPVLEAATAIREQRVPFTFSKAADFKAGSAILRRAGVPSEWTDATTAASYLAQALRATDGDAAAVVGTHVSRVLVNDATRRCLGLPGREHGPAVGERLVARESAGGMANATTCTVVRVEEQDFGDRFGFGWIMEVRTETGGRREVALLEQQWRLVDTPANRGKIPYSVRRMLKAYSEEDAGAQGVEIADRVQALHGQWSEGQDADAEAPRWRQDMWRAQAAREVGAWAIYLTRHLAALDTGYAVTCHAAQGSQWERVMIVSDWVDFLATDPDTGDVDGDTVYRWSYTALTRAKAEALVICKARGGWNRPVPVSGVRLGTAARDWQARRRMRR